MPSTWLFAIMSYLENDEDNASPSPEREASTFLDECKKDAGKRRASLAAKMTSNLRRLSGAADLKIDISDPVSSSNSKYCNKKIKVMYMSLYRSALGISNDWSRLMRLRTNLSWHTTKARQYYCKSGPESYFRTNACSVANTIRIAFPEEIRDLQHNSFSKILQFSLYFFYLIMWFSFYLFYSFPGWWWCYGSRRPSPRRYGAGEIAYKQRHSIHGMMEEENVIRPHQEIQALSFEEKKFLLAVERGDVAGTRRWVYRMTGKRNKRTRNKKLFCKKM